MIDKDLLIEHALKNVWCAPGQDRQTIIKPAKLTTPYGSMREVRIMWQSYPLPDNTSRWHVYQIGGVHPIIFNMFTRCFEWISVKDQCNTQQMVANIYTLKGIELPRYETFYRYTSNQNLIVAIKINPTLPCNLNTEDIFIRVYSNAFFNSTRSDSIADPIQLEGKTIENLSDVTDLKFRYDQYKSRNGNIHVFVNGVRYNEWVSDIMKVGDAVEWFYDASVIKKLKIQIKDLPVFESALDKKRKYLIHYSGADRGTIDYQDDIDVYVSVKQSDTRDRSVYYHKNNPDALRNVTHRDYSINTTYVTRYAETQSLLNNSTPIVNPENMYVEVFIRQSGFERPLVYEANHINELYKLSDELILKAFLGIDSTIAYWRAPYLEFSMYTGIMRFACSEVTQPIVEEAYGYYAASKAIGDSPIQIVPTSDPKKVLVPVKYQYGCTAYEYNDAGLMIGYHHHYAGSEYFCHSVDTETVEFIYGLGSNRLEEYFNKTTLTFQNDRNYRVYYCHNTGGVLDHEYTDATGSNKYTVVNNVFTWNDPNTTLYPVIRSDSRFLALDLELYVIEGQLSFDIAYAQSFNGTLTTKILKIPLGQLEVFLNERTLIKDLDYFVEYPKVFITNKMYLKNPGSEKQKIHIRMHGFCGPNFEIMFEADKGFIEHGFLSNNKRFDVRDSKVSKIVVDGCLKNKNQVQFSEEHTGVNIINASNGSPYMVKDILVPIESVTDNGTFGFRKRALTVEKAISDYLSLKLPQPPRPAPSAIPNRHQLYSPFLCRILFDLKLERLLLPSKPNGFTKQDVIEICKPYESLLQFDPISSVNKQDDRFVVIIPHSLPGVISLTQPQYQFLFQVAKEYSDDRVTLSSYVQMVA